MRRLDAGRTEVIWELQAAFDAIMAAPGSGYADAV
jgi:hypothetical protein